MVGGAHGTACPVGVLASWNAIAERRKVFTHFPGAADRDVRVFVSLDLMVYYGFWELSLVRWHPYCHVRPQERTESRNQVLPLHVYSFGAAPCRNSLDLCAHRHVQLHHVAVLDCSGSLPASALFWVALTFLFAFAVKVPVSRCMVGSADSFSEARLPWP